MTSWHWLLLPLCAIACGWGYRVRGGLTAGTRYQLPGQVARLVFCGIAGLSALAAGAVWWQAAALVPCFFVSCTLPLFNSIDLGGNEGTFAGDFALLAMRGVLAVIFAAVALWWLGFAWWVLAASGPLMAPSYYLARQIRLNVPALGILPADWPPCGEAVFGMAIGVGTFLACAL